MPETVSERIEKVAPPPLMEADAPLNVITPTVEVKELDTIRFPVIVSDAVVLKLPLIVRLLKVMPMPAMVFEVPDNVMIPAPPTV